MKRHACSWHMHILSFLHKAGLVSLWPNPDSTYSDATSAVFCSAVVPKVGVTMGDSGLCPFKEQRVVKGSSTITRITLVPARRARFYLPQAVVGEWGAPGTSL